MLRILTLAALSSTVISGSAFAEPLFNRVASFAVNNNLPADMGQETETSAEIIAASKDGMTLVYSDSPAKLIGFIDITDAKAPKAGGAVKMEGEPTSVAVSGSLVLAGINTSESKSNPSGKLVAIDIASKAIVSECALGGQPDSVAVSPDGSIAAIAVENERDEDIEDGKLPQLPAGFVVILPLKDGAPQCDGLIKVEMTGLAQVGAEDPEPEFIAINAANEIAVTMQENNHIAILAADGKVISHFSAGAVDLEGVDTKSDGAISFTDKKEGVKREPDAVKWLDNDRLAVANEGDYEGGSRSFTIFSKSGEVLFESGLSLEMTIASMGHYPEKRSRAKGVEPEGMEIAKFGETTWIAVMAERASVAGIYKDTGGEPQFVQVVPTGLGPEGAVAIPSRNLLAISNEVDLVEDGGVRSHVTIYELADAPMQYPTIVSANDESGKPIGWGALSGLVADKEKPGILHGVNDSVYFGQPTIYTIDANVTPAKIVSALRVSRGGHPAQLMDMEGITLDGKGGFWVANEGRSDRLVPHGILNVNAKGEIKAEIGLPAELLAGEKRFGFEGIALIGEGDAATLWMAVQREWGDDEKGFVKLVSYNIKSKEWGAVIYPLDKVEGGWVGLSEITVHGDHAYIVERDNQIGEKAAIKKLYRVALGELVPAKLGGALPVVKKEEVRDFLPDMKSFGGYVFDKIEGFAIDAAGNGFAVTDNDGVDDSNGETLFWTIGKVN